MSEKLQLPKFTVTLVGEKPFTVTIPNGAQAQWELERKRKDYPSTDEAPTLWATFVSWTTAKRDPAIKQVPSSMPFEAFMEAVESLEFDEAEEADPTTREAEGGSSSK